MKIDDATVANFGLGGHQHSYFNVFLDLYDLRGKDILEIGGAMPRALVLDVLGANRWTCIQSAEYAEHRSDNQMPQGSESDGRYRALFANAEEILAQPEFHEKYDAVFSIACFEHIHKLPQALSGMHAALKPDGRLFSMFAPIWSGPWGQHFTDPVPDRFAALAPPQGWTTADIFGPWDHLLLSRHQFYTAYRQKFDAAFAAELTWLTFNSPQINRYFFEDYVGFFADAGFTPLILQGVFPFPETAESAAALATLRQRHAAQGYRDFSHAGIAAFLSKA